MATSRVPDLLGVSTYITSYGLLERGVNCLFSGRNLYKRVGRKTRYGLLYTYGLFCV